MGKHARLVVALLFLPLLIVLVSGMSTIGERRSGALGAEIVIAAADPAINTSSASYTWTRKDVDYYDRMNLDLFDVAALDAEHVWAVGMYGYERRGQVWYLNGSEWELQHDGGSELQAVALLDANHVWAVGGDGTILFNNGTGWTAQNSGTTAYLLGVSAYDASHVWAVGENGTVLFYNGTSWAVQSSGVMSRLFDVCALDASHVWAVGDAGNIYFFDGANWAFQYGGATYELKGVSALDANHVWAVGGEVNRDVVCFFDGSNWSAGSIGANEVLWDVDAYSNDRVWAVGEGGFYLPYGALYLYDGTGWAQTNYQESWSYLGVDVIDEYHVVVVGYASCVVFGERLQPPPDPPPGYGNTRYFAEGYTGSGFQEYLCLGNPTGDATGVQVVYLYSDGRWKEEAYTLAPGSRFTLDVNAAVGPDRDVSVRIASDASIVAERPMYFDYQGKWKGGHDTAGARSPSTTWYLAEGYTGAGFDEWICLQNPGDQEATVEITYYTQEAGALPPRTETVPARTRRTIMVNEHAGQNYQLSAGIRVTSGPAIVVERPMYFIFNGRDGGHDIVGESG